MQETSYLSAILSGDRIAIARMYATLFPAIRKLLHDHGGSEADAKDVFQDAVIVIYEKAQKPDFQLTSKFSTFFYGICHNIWRSRLQRKSSSEKTIPDDAKYIADSSFEIDLLQIERNKLFYKALRQLGEDCQKLLELFFQKLPMEQIADVMGFSNENHARVRKSRCRDRLVELIKKDAAYPELQTV